MSLLAPWGLLLLLALPALVWLALRRAQPVTQDVGTLMLWRVVAQAVPAPDRRSRRLDLLLWLLATAALAGAFGASGPALVGMQPTPVVAIYVERLGTGAPEPELDGVRERVQQQFPGAQLHWWFAGDAALLEDLGLVQSIRPGPPQAEQGQFVAASRGAGLRVMFLAQPRAAAHPHTLVLPRVTSPRRGVVFEVRSEGETLFVRSGPGLPPKVEGAALQGAGTRGDEVVRQYRAVDAQVRISTATQTITLVRQALSVGVGADWASPRHRALLTALQPALDGTAVQVWLGGRDVAPCIGVGRGTAQDLAGTETQVDLQSPLFQDLPLATLELNGQSRLLAPRPQWRALAVVLRDGRVLGDLAALSPDGRVLEFANDPFADSSLTAAALLLDNAMGVVTGKRPSEHELYQQKGDVLPTRRQAMAAPFEAAGSLEPEQIEAETTPVSQGPLLLAALCSLAGAGLAARPRARRTVN